MNRSTVHNRDDHKPGSSYETPRKAKVQGAVEFCEKQGIEYFKSDVFCTFNVKPREGYHYLRSGNSSNNYEQDDHSSRRLGNNSDEEETRGRHSLVTPAKIREMERVLETEGMEARSLTWEQLGFEVGLEVSGRTIERAMGTMDYHKCIACLRGWVNPRTAQHRVEWATIMLERYPNPTDWEIVRFSDEVHFGWGPQHKLRIIRKPGQRYCIDCLQHQDSPKAKDEKRMHCWAAVGYNFKSPIYFYDVPGNTNGKMSLKVYQKQILEPIVKPWLECGQRFVLEEDGDSGHGTGKSNIVRTWKQQNRLQYYFNCHSSPDLSPIENCWQAPKQYIKKYPHWDDATTKILIYEGWNSVSQKGINEHIHSMPQRLRDCIASNGAMIGY